MRFILSSHPRLFVPAETGFLPLLETDPAELLTLHQVGIILEKIGRMNLDWANLVTDLSDFFTSLPTPNLSHIIDALYRIKLKTHQAARWGDKTPSYILYLPVIHSIFPQAQYIHVIRDGRDTALSAAQKWGGFRRAYMTEYYLLTHWVRNIKAGQAFGHGQSKDKYFELRYEDLVQDPENTLKSVCAFLKETFHPAMLDHSALARQTIGARGHIEVKQPIRTTSLQRWENEMSPFSKKLANQLAGPTLKTLGYSLTSFSSFKPPEKIKVIYYTIHFWIIDRIRTALQQAGWLKPNRGKRRIHLSK